MPDTQRKLRALRRRLREYQKKRQLTLLKNASRGELTASWLTEFANGKYERPSYHKIEALEAAMELIES